MSVAAIILAAGESRRMGKPKALLRYEDETFVDRLIGIFARHCSPVILVLGAGAEEIRAGMTRAGQATVVVNADHARGQISSLQCGLRAAPPDVPGVVFTLVDHPAVKEETVSAMLGGGQAVLRIPRYRGRRGHPVYAGAALVPEFLAVGASGTARDVVERHAAEIEYIDVDDPGAVADIDDPEAYRRMTGGVVA